MMKDLLDLPEEVLSLIISQLDVVVFYDRQVFTTKHWPTLFSLSLSCQRLRRLVRPHMVEELTFIASAHIDRDRQRLARYLTSHENTITMRTETKAVRLFDTGWHAYRPAHEAQAIMKLLMRSSSLTKLHLKLHHKRLLHDQLTAKIWSHYWASLANYSFQEDHCPNLINAGPDHIDDTSSPFPSLKELKLEYTSGKASSFTKPRLLLRLLALPRIERMETTQPIMYRDSESRPEVRLRRKVLRLRELICWDIHLRRDVLELIISHAPYLQVLNIPSVTPVYVNGSPFVDSKHLRNPRRFAPHELLELLHPIESTLRHLCLRDEPSAEALDRSSSLDLSTFTSLHILEIPGYLLIGKHNTVLEMSASYFGSVLPLQLREIHLKISGDQGLLYTPTELLSAFKSGEEDWNSLWDSRTTALRHWLQDLTKAPFRLPALHTIGAYEYACCSNQRHSSIVGEMCEIQAAEWNLEPSNSKCGITVKSILRFPESASHIPRCRSPAYLEGFYGKSRAPRYYEIPEGVEAYEDAIYSGDRGTRGLSLG